MNKKIDQLTDADLAEVRRVLLRLEIERLAQSVG